MDFTHSYCTQEQSKLKQALLKHKLSHHADALVALNELGWQKIFKHGDFNRWADALNGLPDISISEVSFSDIVSVGADVLSGNEEQQVKQCLQKLCPWRKGPFDILGVHIDTEWHSDWKWNRVIKHIAPLEGRKILDIGCGSGYHLWRMLEHNAQLVVGIDPSPLFSFHFSTVKRYVPEVPVFLIPTGIDEMPQDMQSFDTVFSMGILYHRKEPLDHLFKLKSLLNNGGELVLETLVIDGDEQTCLVPESRYAKMKNVWFIPSVAMLELWLRRAGFKNIRCVDLNVTSLEEQRSTAWMGFESLVDFLDPSDNSKTVEGYPAPKRAVILANS